MVDGADGQTSGGDSLAVPLLSGLTDALDGLIETVELGELRRLDHAELIRFIAGFEQIRNRLSLIDHQIVIAVDQGGLTDALVAGSPAAAVSRIARVSGAEAARRVHAAHALSRPASMTGEMRPAPHPALAEAARSGQIPTDSAHIAVRCLRRLERRYFATTDQLAFAETHLVSAALTLGPEQLRRVASTIEDVVFPDGCLTDEHHVADARDLTLTPKADGSWLIDGRLTGLCGAAFSATINALAAPAPTPDGAPDPRSAGQRRHDALHTWSMTALRSGQLPRSGGIPASIIVTINHTDLLHPTGHGAYHGNGQGNGHGSGHGTTGDGGTLNVAEIMRLADEAELLPTLLTRGFAAGGLQLTLGRTRRCATEHQTKALIARDGGCSFPHCTAPPTWCDRHHLVAWRDNGPTNIDNLTLLCTYHHTYFEHHHWTGHMINGLPHWTPPPWIDPHQTPLLHDRIRARHVFESSA